MKSYLISDDQDTLIGMRIAGIKGVIATSKEEILKEVDGVIENDEIRILIITEPVFSMAEEEIMELKIKKDDLLVVEIPNRFGSTRGDYITKYIRESIGLRI